MERLTFEVHDGGMFVKESDIKTFNVEDDVMHTGNAVRRLAEYEDLEEQGKLLKLPCKIGDRIYWISDINEEGYEEDNIQRTEPIKAILLKKDGFYVSIWDCQFEKLGSRYAILTYQEALEKLEELKKEEKEEPSTDFCLTIS